METTAETESSEIIKEPSEEIVKENESTENCETVNKVLVPLIDNENKENYEEDESDVSEHTLAKKEENNIASVSSQQNISEDQKLKYEWSADKNQWVNIETGEPQVETQTESGENMYENEHYRWDLEKNEWILKNQDITENEFYTWCEITNKWIPKPQSQEVTTSYEDGVHLYTDKDGAVFFWDETKNAWFPRVDDDFIARYQMSYGFIDNVTPPTVVAPEKNKPITEQDISKDPNSTALKRKAQPEPPTWFELNPEQNTKVYVSNLPFDTTEEEFINLMSKCGLIVRDQQTQKMKVKLYKDSNGMLKGDALCDYIRMESVELALNLLDGSDFNGKKITVERAKFQMRGDYNPALKPKKKKKEKEKLKKIQEKLFDWRPERMRGERAKHERVVIIKNLFTPELFEKEVHLIIDYQKDLREECSKCGKVRKVIVYDRHPEGVAQISMGDPEEADVVVQLLNGRFFGTRKLVAELWDGQTKYKIGETETENTQRLSNWDKFLESDESNENNEVKVPVIKKDEDKDIDNDENNKVIDDPIKEDNNSDDDDDDDHEEYAEDVEKEQ